MLDATGAVRRSTDRSTTSASFLQRRWHDASRALSQRAADCEAGGGSTSLESTFGSVVWHQERGLGNTTNSSASSGRSAYWYLYILLPLLAVLLLCGSFLCYFFSNGNHPTGRPEGRRRSSSSTTDSSGSSYHFWHSRSNTLSLSSNSDTRMRWTLRPIQRSTSPTADDVYGQTRTPYTSQNPMLSTGVILREGAESAGGRVLRMSSGRPPITDSERPPDAHPYGKGQYWRAHPVEENSQESSDTSIVFYELEPVTDLESFGRDSEPEYQQPNPHSPQRQPVAIGVLPHSPY